MVVNSWSLLFQDIYAMLEKQKPLILEAVKKLLVARRKKATGNIEEDDRWAA